MNCESGANPFEKFPVESFVPPKKSKAADVLIWRNLVKDMISTIGKIQIGGDPLRARISEEVMKLEVKRLEIFCPYLVPSLSP